uniref:Uncharacterized protein n=1 Tax=Solanum tuberosum TaxID=4113 RepID=M1B6I1_SOLTU
MCFLILGYEKFKIFRLYFEILLSNKKSEFWFNILFKYLNCLIWPSLRSTDFYI